MHQNYAFCELNIYIFFLPTMMQWSKYRPVFRIRFPVSLSMNQIWRQHPSVHVWLSLIVIMKLMKRVKFVYQLVLKKEAQRRRRRKEKAWFTARYASPFFRVHFSIRHGGAYDCKRHIATAVHKWIAKDVMPCKTIAAHLAQTQQSDAVKQADSIKNAEIGMAEIITLSSYKFLFLGSWIMLFPCG